MTDFHKDIYIGALFVMGMFGFMSGEFIISSALFAVATIGSNITLNRHSADTRGSCMRLLWPAAGQAWIGQRWPAPPEVADALIGLPRGTS